MGVKVQTVFVRLYNCRSNILAGQSKRKEEKIYEEEWC